ncbi:MAG TPA: hypothetical protein VH370_06560 [Humisphaera sp.]|nr:hypothetical protein [Humisphaera sp.]
MLTLKRRVRRAIEEISGAKRAVFTITVVRILLRAYCGKHWLSGPTLTLVVLLVVGSTLGLAAWVRDVSPEAD